MSRGRVAVRRLRGASRHYHAVYPQVVRGGVVKTPAVLILGQGTHVDSGQTSIWWSQALGSTFTVTYVADQADYAGSPALATFDVFVLPGDGQDPPVAPSVLADIVALAAEGRGVVSSEWIGFYGASWSALYNVLPMQKTVADTWAHIPTPNQLTITDSTHPVMRTLSSPMDLGGTTNYWFSSLDVSTANGGSQIATVVPNGAGTTGGVFVGTYGAGRLVHLNAVYLRPVAFAPDPSTSPASQLVRNAVWWAAGGVA